MEMLPLSYSFALSRGYARQEKSQNTGTSSTVTFSTTLVTMELRDHSGALLGEGDGLQYYAGGWRTFGSGNTTGGYETMEMLPLSYSFALSYGYARQEKSQNVSSNSTVTYNTTLVTVRLDDGASGLNGGAAKYYAGGWRTFGTTGSSATGECQKEMLPLSYSFSMDYSAKHKEKSDAISGTTDNVNFVYSGGSLNRVVTKTTGKEGSKLVAGQDATTDNSNQIGKAESNSVPVVTGLTCYPNPTVSSATVAYQLSSTQQVSVDVYAANGVRVMTLSNGIQDAGNHSASLSADQLKGGIYYVRVITASGISQVPVMVNK